MKHAIQFNHGNISKIEFIKQLRSDFGLSLSETYALYQHAYQNENQPFIQNPVVTISDFDKFGFINQNFFEHFYSSTSKFMLNGTEYIKYVGDDSRYIYEDPNHVFDPFKERRLEDQQNMTDLLNLVPKSKRKIARKYLDKLMAPTYPYA